MRSISKRLITKNNVESFIDKAHEAIYMEADMILTPGAKDVLRNLGVTIKFGSKPCDEKQSCVNEIESIKSQVIEMLRNDYKIKDTKVMTEILKGVLEKL